MTDDTLPMMSGAVKGSDDNDVLVVREVALRSELTPPPSEPSPSMQSRRCPQQTQRVMPEVITPNSQPSSIGRHTQSNGVQYQQHTSLGLRSKCAPCTPSSVLPRSNLPGSPVQPSSQLSSNTVRRT
ncbi:hypothetical protein CNMCM8980_002848 [Aspergillus fumigatiaffinis]|uniref:Uncharacterized protein n=1 Tax=Aspergillus fumigatiaffinis TaxID=340414 RepID=A0A8H4GP31_9EURO|nr:hypothetical protein CNMCM5878_010515 [Aspergillus fumigatiaffinis]KAF4225662.1 hypothetical protein CNMCM6457_007826 [Aspergillus fumigatiaffinis]KAF4241414.1 hypothetical protein CNMCM6805_004072 [Aspergillus fumigatiaffinis]KAF4249742.1 hypothetical protein CNMCM8980_002848 [Aspergillus fumigatiaffinis]